MTPQTAVTHVFGGTSTSAVAVCDRGLSLLKTVTFFSLRCACRTLKTAFGRLGRPSITFVLFPVKSRKWASARFKRSGSRSRSTSHGWLAIWINTVLGVSCAEPLSQSLPWAMLPLAAMLTGKNIVRCVPAPAHQLARDRSCPSSRRRRRLLQLLQHQLLQVQRWCNSSALGRR